jgi:hypothetical protein
VPTEIQKKQPLLLENKTDLVGLAKNRNWKTLLLIASLQLIDTNIPMYKQ